LLLLEAFENQDSEHHLEEADCVNFVEGGVSEEVRGLLLLEAFESQCLECHHQLTLQVAC
jgi:hypothetical protein